MSTRHHALILSVFVVFLSPFAGRLQAADVTIDQIVQAWKARQDKATTARFEMDCERTIPKGSITLKASGAGVAPKGPPSTAVNPPEDLIVKGTSSVSLSGAKMRYSFAMPRWSSAKQELYDVHYLDTFDGKLLKSLEDPAQATEPHPMGYIKKSERPESVLQFAIVPLTWAVRGHHARYFSDIAKFEVAAKSQVVNGRPCVELARHNSANKYEHFFLDTERDYVVVRKTTTVDDKPTWQIDVTYVADAKIGWVPQSWEYVIRIGKDLVTVESGKRTVTKHEIGAELNDDEFDIVFPPKTHVLDNSAERSVQYVIQKDNEKGRIVPSEQGVSYEEMLKPEWRPSTRVRLLALGVLVSAGIVVALWLIRKRKSNPK